MFVIYSDRSLASNCELAGNPFDAVFPNVLSLIVVVRTARSALKVFEIVATSKVEFVGKVDVKGSRGSCRCELRICRGKRSPSTSQMVQASTISAARRSRTLGRPGSSCDVIGSKMKHLVIFRGGPVTYVRSCGHKRDISIRPANGDSSREIPERRLGSICGMKNNWGCNPAAEAFPEAAV